MKSYREQMDALHFTQAQKDQMVEQLLQTPQKNIRKPHLRRATAIGIAAALALTVGAGATVAASDAFFPLFGTSQTEIIDKIGRPIGASVSDNGYTLSADAVMGDKYSICMIFTLSRDDGQTFPVLAEDPESFLHFGDSSLSTGLFSGAHGTSRFIDEDPTDNKIQYVEMMTYENGVQPGAVTAKFQDLVQWDVETGESTTVIQGDWKMRFQSRYEDLSVSLETGQTPYTLNGMPVEIEEVSLSPLSIYVAYTVGEQVEWGQDRENGRESPEQAAQTQKFLGDFSLQLHLKDGRTIDCNDAGGSIGPEDGKTHCTKSMLFDELIPLEDVESITLCGQTLPITPAA